MIELTNDIAAQFETVTMDHDMRLFANAQRHIAAVEALEDIEAVLDYDYSTGWQP
ncbi:putative cytoplasmic protein [Salmonella enterica subsp. enterica]|nr:putative cytoplasmic protein [Salmonella enterica subsp. enterica]